MFARYYIKEHGTLVQDAGHLSLAGTKAYLHFTCFVEQIRIANSPGNVFIAIQKYAKMQCDESDQEDQQSVRVKLELSKSAGFTLTKDWTDVSSTAGAFFFFLMLRFHIAYFSVKKRTVVVFQDCEDSHFIIRDGENDSSIHRNSLREILHRCTIIIGPFTVERVCFFQLQPLSFALSLYPYK